MFSPSSLQKIMKVEAARSRETWETFYQTTLCHRRENFKAHEWIYNKCAQVRLVQLFLSVRSPTLHVRTANLRVMGSTDMTAGTPSSFARDSVSNKKKKET